MDFRAFFEHMIKKEPVALIKDHPKLAEIEKKMNEASELIRQEQKFLESKIETYRHRYWKEVKEYVDEHIDNTIDVNSLLIDNGVLYRKVKGDE